MSEIVLEYKEEQSKDFSVYCGKEYIGLICTHHERPLCVADDGDFYKHYDTLDDAKDGMVKWCEFKVARERLAEEFFPDE